VAIGFGKTKWFGLVKGEVKKVKFTFSREPRGIEHMGSLMATDDERNRYGVTSNAHLPLDGFAFDEQGGAKEGLGWLHRRAITADASINTFFENVKGEFKTYIDTLAKKGVA
jgi:hypothetical protein